MNVEETKLQANDQKGNILRRREGDGLDKPADELRMYERKHSKWKKGNNGVCNQRGQQERPMESFSVRTMLKRCSPLSDYSGGNTRREG